MRHITPGLTLAGIAALLLVACGGGGGLGSGSSSSGGAANTAPIANAGTNQTVTSGVIVALNGTASSDTDGTIASFAWTQTVGTVVTLAGGTTSQPTFTAPLVAAATTLTFSLVVTDNRGATSPAATVNVIVNPIAGGGGNVVGRITFARVPFAGSTNLGLNYASPVQQPSRGVLVRAIDAGTQVVLATTSTDSLGNYSLSVAANTTITIQVVARMLRDNTQALPRWDMRVQDGVPGVTPYTYTDGVSFNSNAATAHDVAIPTGIAANGTAAGARPSGPFAALDTVYQAMQTILSADALTNFPPLIVDWGSQADGTFFTAQGGQHIALLADLTEDTDEFDQHVIAHEFGHYIEFNFSRADNIGGTHGLGDKLDPRVAFGEGFGYAFAAIVLNDRVARDSFVDTSLARCGAVQCSSSFNVETNPPTAQPGNPIGNYGCWCSESSAWSILWDLYDNAADTNDNVALGFQPIWDVLIGPERTTPAFTTIFSFITALKSQNPGSVAAINTLVAAQNIDAATIDAYGSTETHFPSSVPSNAALPLYAVANVGGPAVVMRTMVASADPLDRFNKLGNRRFVRFTLATARTITINAMSSNLNNPDVDFDVFRNGAFVNSATNPPAASEQITLNNAAAGEYLIDVYDCANGCDTPEGTPGDYNLTLTVN
jgi:hypothetical protein